MGMDQSESALVLALCVGLTIGSPGYPPIVEALCRPAQTRQKQLNGQNPHRHPVEGGFGVGAGFPSPR